MKRALLSVILITFLLSSCITGGNVFSAGGSNGSRLIDALSERPGRRTEERPIEEVLSSVAEVPEEDVMLEVPAEKEQEPVAEEPAEEESVAAEPAIVPVIDEETKAEPLPAETEAPAVSSEPPVAVAGPVEEDIVAEDVPEEPAPASEEPVAIVEEESMEEPPVAEAEPASEPQIITVEAEPELIHYGMDGWMLRLLVVSVAAIILFTAATAIRSGARRPLSKAVSALLAVAFTAVPWIITVIAAGTSWFWCIYLVMLLSYIIFRSGNR